MSVTTAETSFHHFCKKFSSPHNERATKVILTKVPDQKFPKNFHFSRIRAYEQSQRQKNAYRTYYTYTHFASTFDPFVRNFFQLNPNFSFLINGATYIFLTSSGLRGLFQFWLANPTNIADANNPNPPTPADRLVPVHSWRLVIVPCGLILCASLVRFCLNARSRSRRLANPTQRPTQPNPTNIANANPNTPTPADRVVPVSSWRLDIVPCGLIL